MSLLGGGQTQGFRVARMYSKCYLDMFTLYINREVHTTIFEYGYVLSLLPYLSLLAVIVWKRLDWANKDTSINGLNEAALGPGHRHTYAYVGHILKLLSLVTSPFGAMLVA